MGWMANLGRMMFGGVEPTAHVLPTQTGFGWGGEKFSGGWGPDAFLTELESLDYFTLRARSHQLFEQNMYARGIVRRLVTNEVHVGLDLEAAPMESILGREQDSMDAWTDEVEARFSLWSLNSQVCDYEQKTGATLGWLTAAARREALVGGDVLVVLRQNPDTNLPMIQLIGGHMVQSTLNQEIPEEYTLEHGVELDARGRHVAYYVQSDDLLKSTRIAARGAGGRRVAWLMYGTDRRVGNVRGAPLLSLILQSLREIDRYRDSAQRKALVNSIFAMWIEKSQDKPGSLGVSRAATRRDVVNDLDSAGEQRSFNVADNIPGVVIETLQHGEKPHGFTSQGTDVDFRVFEAGVIAAMAWHFEIPPEILTLSFDRNYAASAAALNEFKMYLTVARRTLAQQFNQPIYEDWLLSETLRGSVFADGFVEAAADPAKFDTYGAWTHADWIGAVKPVTDLLKAVRAQEIMVDRGWTTPELVSRELTGTKFARNARKVLKARELLPPPEPTQGEPENALATD